MRVGLLFCVLGISYFMYEFLATPPVEIFKRITVASIFVIGALIFYFNWRDYCKVIVHNTKGIFGKEDLTLPYRLEVNLKLPESYQISFNMALQNGEKLVVRSRSLKGIKRFIKTNDFRTHPRLKSFSITGPRSEVLDL